MKPEEIKKIVYSIGGCQHVAGILNKSRRTIEYWCSGGSKPDRANIEKLRELYEIQRQAL